MAGKKRSVLTGKQLRFVQEYCKDFEPTLAAKRAGYFIRPNREGGHSAPLRLLGYPHIQAEIVRIRQEVHCAAVADASEACEVLTRILRCKLSDILTDGKIDPDKVQHCKQELQEFTESYGKDTLNRKVKFRDPVAAIERLSKILGWDAAQKTQSENVSLTGHTMIDTGTAEFSAKVHAWRQMRLAQMAEQEQKKKELTL